MQFSYDYSLMEEFILSKSGVLFAVKVENFWLLGDSIKYEECFLSFKTAIEKNLKFKTFFQDQNTFFIVCNDKNAGCEDITQDLTKLGFDLFGVYLIFSVGCASFEQEKPRDIVHRALKASALVRYEYQSTLCDHDCKDYADKFCSLCQKSACLYQALQKKDVYFAFQPVIDIKEKKVLFHEVLLRIKDQEVIHEFISASEKTGLILAVDKFVITEVVKLMQESPDLVLSVNVSIVSISNKKWVSDILFLFKSVPQIANRVILEITESNIIRDYKSVFDFIFKFMSIGCKVALDDFGKNPCLQFIEVEKLAVEFIKLDGDFAKGILSNTNIKILSDAVAKIARNQNVKVIAEFVESKEIAEAFEYMGINYMQGDYFGKALPRLQKSLGVDE